MPRCNKCGQPVHWIRTPAGKNMPVDLGEAAVIDDPVFGTVFAVWPDGSVGKAMIVSENDETGYEYCRISHFSTCKGGR